MFTVYAAITGDFNTRESFKNLNDAITYAEARLLDGCYDSINVYDSNGNNCWNWG